MLCPKLVLLLTEIFQYWLCLRNTTSFIPPRYRKSRGTSYYTKVSLISTKITFLLKIVVLAFIYFSCFIYYLIISIIYLLVFRLLWYFFSCECHMQWHLTTWQITHHKYVWLTTLSCGFLEYVVWFGLVLWHINNCVLFNAKSGLFTYNRYIWLVNMSTKLNSSKYYYVSLTSVICLYTVQWSNSSVSNNSF